MRLVAEGLQAREFDVRLPEFADERRLRVERWGGRCDLSVSDLGLVEWECTPWASREPDPELIADIVTFLLTGEAGNHPPARNVSRLPGMSFRAAVGNELRARGLDVRLEVYEDNKIFDVWAELQVVNPAIHDQAFAFVSDDGAIAWEREYPCELMSITGSLKYFEALANYRELAASITATVARAVSLSAGMSTCGGD